MGDLLPSVKEHKKRLEQSDELLDEAEVKFDTCEFDEALELYTKSIGVNPANSRAYAGRALCYYEKSKLSHDSRDSYLNLSLEDFTASLKFETDPDIYENRADIKYELGDLNGAIDDLLFVAKLNPHDKDISEKIKLKKRERGDYSSIGYLLDKNKHHHDLDLENLFTKMNRTTSMFITGKAGAGKSTIIREFKKWVLENFPEKNIVLLSFTNLAAINIGGQTIHSFFRFNQNKDMHVNAMRPLEYDDKNLYSAIDMIIIDEISMVRTDVFDAMDVFLRRCKEIELPFGGTQIIICGDYFQLPPIDEAHLFSIELLVNKARNEEIIRLKFREKGILIPDVEFAKLSEAVCKTSAELDISDDNGESYLASIDNGFLRVYYSKLLHGHKLRYVFDSDVYGKMLFERIVLTKGWRYNDENYVRILNSIRQRSDDLLEKLRELNTRVNYGFNPSLKDEIVILTPTKRRAKEINMQMLKQLPGELFVFEAQFVNHYPNAHKKNWLMDERLELKADCKIIFLTNDSKGRWVNGTPGRVVSVEPGRIIVKIEDGLNAGEIVEVLKVTLRKIAYRFDRVSNKIIEIPISECTQYPISLAWAMTIHKSQGKTYDKICIDFGDKRPWDHGQTYVALSRCRSLDGLVLKTPILESDIIIDERVIDYLKKNDLLVN